MVDITASEERLISAAMLGGPECVATLAAAGVSQDVFASALCRGLWSGLVEASIKAQKTTAFYVGRHAYGAEINAQQSQDLARIAALESTSMYAATLAEKVIGEHKRKGVLGALTAAVETLYTDPEWGNAWEAASTSLNEAQRIASAASKLCDLKALCAEAIAVETSDKPTGKLGSGVKTVDVDFGMITPGEVVVIAGRPGVGKTALALQSADAVVLAGGCAMFVSLEMQAPVLIGRLARQRNPSQCVIRRGCSADDYAHAKIARVSTIEQIATADGRLYFYDVRDCGTVSKIEARARLLASRSTSLDVVVVDYLQLVTPEDTRANREQQVSAISRRLKLLALELNVPILLLSQLNRDSEKDGREPRLSDLRESGAIEQDADRVWLLYPDPKTPPDSSATSMPVVLKQSKCRNGESGIAVELNFYKPAFRFDT